MNATTIRASRQDWVSAISTAGTPLIQGPKKGMISQSPASTPSSRAKRTPSRV